MDAERPRCRAPFALVEVVFLAFRWARYDPCPRMARITCLQFRSAHQSSTVTVAGRCLAASWASDRTRRLGACSDPRSRTRHRLRQGGTVASSGARRFDSDPPSINAAGRSMAARLEDHYNRRSSLSPERVRYYEALRCAVELAIVASRCASDEPGFATSGWYHGPDALTRHFGEVTGTPIPRFRSIDLMRSSTSNRTMGSIADWLVRARRRCFEPTFPACPRYAGSVRPVSDAAVLIWGAGDRCHQPELLIPRCVHIALGHPNRTASPGRLRAGPNRRPRRRRSRTP